MWFAERSRARERDRMGRGERLDERKEETGVKTERDEVYMPIHYLDNFILLLFVYLKIRKQK